jgi:alpha-ribazole phosphatase/probable phosphoglycerate mutase
MKPHGVSWIYTSTAVRAAQTGEIFADELRVGTTALPELLEVDLGRSEGTTDPVIISRTAKVLRSWVSAADLGDHIDDGEDGYAVVSRVARAFQKIEHKAHGSTVVVIGHVASLTAGLSKMCDLGMSVWGLPLPHAVPFAVERRGDRWWCDAWPRHGQTSAVCCR